MNKLAEMLEEIKSMKASERVLNATAVLFLVTVAVERQGMEATIADIKEALKEHPGPVGGRTDEYKEKGEKAWIATLDNAKLMCAEEAKGRKEKGWQVRKCG